MPAVTRVGDPTNCGGQAINGSPTVWVNGVPVHRVGDTNTCGSCAPPTQAPVTSGSLTVFANNFGLARVGDPDGCPGTMSGGSPDVFAN